MSKGKKLLLTGVICVILIAGTLGGFAIANADDEDSTNTTTQVTSQANLMEKVAEIYQTNTGTAIDAQQLQKAFDEAREAIKSDALDQYLQKLVDKGTITQEQADQFKTWWNARPNAITDEFKQWLESRPDIPGLFGSGKFGGMMPFNGGINRTFGNIGRGMMGQRFGNCFPNSGEQ